MTHHLSRLLNGVGRPNILVVGDVMLDRYIWGNVDRISYEAPIPVLRMDRREERLGGAGSVVANLAAMEVDVFLASVVGDDADGRVVRDLLQALDVSTEVLVVAADRSTTVKERLLGRTQSRHPQQMIRVDRENTAVILDEAVDRLLESIQQCKDKVDAVLVSDYRKGVCADRLVKEISAAFRQRGIPVIADPARDVPYDRYAGCSAVTPNRTEAGLALGRRILTPEDGIQAARDLLEIGIDAAVVTLDRDGIAWADKQGRADLFTVEQRQVYDVTGAGDAVLGALGYGLAVGGDWPEAIRLANLAGGWEVQRLGVVPFGRDDLIAELARDHLATQDKVLSLERLEARLRELRHRGQRIVMTNGCFDLIHPGHVTALEFARQQGDCLVVGLNSDQSVRQLKGTGRPIIDQQGRAAMLTALASVDYVVIFDDTSVAGLVERVAPDVLVKSAQYGPDQVVGHEILQRQGGEIVLAPMSGDYSTSWLIDRIRKTKE